MEEEKKRRMEQKMLQSDEKVRSSVALGRSCKTRRWQLV